jgi:DNA excision repair protein ERCC-2
MAEEIYFRHATIRQHQKELLRDINDAIENGENLIAHAPVGLGKTDSAIGAALTQAMKNDLTVFFLTPKISQHRIAVEVAQGIAKKYELDLKCLDLVGRRYTCIDPTLSELDHDGFYQSCERKRKREECMFYGNAKGYGKLGEAKATHNFKKMLEEYGVGKKHNELIALGEKHSCCPYEWMTKLGSMSRIIIADYFHLMIPKIREIFLKKAGKKMENSIVIIDEAHNLSKRIREQLSSSINTMTLIRATKEIRMLGGETTNIESQFVKWAGESMKHTNERLASKDEFNVFLSNFEMTYDDLAAHFESMGVEFVEKTNKKSACLRFANFIRKWQEEEVGSVRILRKNGEYLSLAKRFLDSSPATKILNDTHSSILMSGTLLPLEMHRDVIGLDAERTVMKKYETPFDKKNIINIVVDGTTTRYSQRNFANYQIMANKIDKIICKTPGGVAVYFPSYAVMNNVLPMIKSKNLHVQKEKMTPKETLELIRRFSAGGVLCGVQGGSISEGVDFCNGEIKTVIVVGIALEEMDTEIKSLINYYQDKFGKGWEYGYIFPGIIKALQAAGRSIRKETDRSAIVFMDERFKWSNYKRAMGDLRFVSTSEPEEYVEEFFKESR